MKKAATGLERRLLCLAISIVSKEIRPREAYAGSIQIVARSVAVVMSTIRHAGMPPAGFKHIRLGRCLVQHLAVTRDGESIFGGFVLCETPVVEDN